MQEVLWEPATTVKKDIHGRSLSLMNFPTLKQGYFRDTSTQPGQTWTVWNEVLTLQAVS